MQLGLINSVKLVSAVKADPGESIFTTSGIFTVPRGIKEIEVFCVGGGQNGGSGYAFEIDSGADRGCYWFNGGGGGSGYAKQSKIQNTKSGEQIPVSIGSADSATIVKSVSSLYSISGYGGSGRSETNRPWIDDSPATAGSNGMSIGGTIYGSGGGGGGYSTYGGASGGTGAGNGGNGSRGGNGGFNTGGGGGGGYCAGFIGQRIYEGGSGGTGIAIIRWS